MSLLEKIWLLISISIILIVLSTSPKSSANGNWNNQLSMVFSSVSDGQTFLKRLNWLLITLFFLITLSLSYFS